MRVAYLLLDPELLEHLLARAVRLDNRADLLVAGIALADEVLVRRRDAGEREWDGRVCLDEVDKVRVVQQRRVGVARRLRAAVLVHVDERIGIFEAGGE